MVSGVSELLEVREILEQEKTRLAAMGKIIGSPRIGVMIEVPSAVLMVKELVEEADFICLGTNDLIQYLLAVDRDNEAVSGWFRSLHPAVLRAIRSVVDAAAAAGKELVACGEMAGSPYYAPGPHRPWDHEPEHESALASAGAKGDRRYCVRRNGETGQKHGEHPHGRRGRRDRERAYPRSLGPSFSA